VNVKDLLVSLCLCASVVRLFRPIEVDYYHLDSVLSLVVIKEAVNLTAKSLILDLLSTLRDGSAMPVGALVEAGSLFGLSGNNMRVSIARLLAGGQIARDERGHYRLGGKAQPIGRRVRSWRQMNRQTRKWSGAWIAAQVGNGGRADRRERERALHLLGFAPLRPALWLRPDNLAASVEEVRGELHLLGLPGGDLVFLLRELDVDNEKRARALWGVEAMRHSYGALREEIARSAQRLEELPPEEAMCESFALGGRVLRQLVLDPLLPEEICPAAERDALLAAMRDYDRQGRLAWANLLKRFDVPYLRAPLDSRFDGSARTAEMVSA
jgi:phenylacetic acid degradation operon negative regulatory protein